MRLHEKTIPQRGITRLTNVDRREQTVVRRFAAAYNRHDVVEVLDSIDPRCSFPVLTKFGIEPTFENYRKFTASFLAALPDLHHTIEGMVAEDEKVWVNYTIRGTHEGLFRNVPATHKHISWSLIAMYRVVNGRIVEADFQSDDLSLLRQLGALPAS